MKRAFLGIAALALLLVTADSARAQFGVSYSTRVSNRGFVTASYGYPAYGYGYYGGGYRYASPAYYPSTYYSPTGYYATPSYVVPAGYVAPETTVYAPATTVYYTTPTYYYPARRWGGGWRYRW